MKKGDTLKTTVGKAKEGIKKFESMSSTVEPTEEKKNGNKKKQEKGKDGEKISWKKQNIWIWHPRFNISKAIPILLVIGIVCIIIGAIMLVINHPVREVVVDYTECISTLPGVQGRSCHDILNVPKEMVSINNRSVDIYVDPVPNANSSIYENLSVLRGEPCVCEKSIDIGDFPKDGLSGDVFMYYYLTNLHQNHRQYVKSRDNKQLRGDMNKTPDALSDIKCTSHFDFADEEEKIPYFPCGAIANSLFNDTITLQYREKDDSGQNQWINVPVVRTGIAHPTDIKYMFKNPPIENITAIRKILKNSDAANDNSLRDLNVEWPKDWGTHQKKIWLHKKGDETNVGEDSNVGFQNEDFIIWMRPATNPNFRKLYAKIGAEDSDVESSAISPNEEDNKKFKDGLPGKYEYQFKIEYNYNAKSYGGTKQIILSTTSILGGKNCGGGVTYFLSGVISLIISVCFLALNKKGFSRKLESTV